MMFCTLTALVLLAQPGAAPAESAEYAQLQAGWWQQAEAVEAAASGELDPGWRRTSRGWEHVDAWPRIDRPGRAAPPVHPLALAAAQLLALLLALSLCGRSESARA